MQKQQKVQQKLNKQEIDKMLSEQKNVLTKEDVNKFFAEYKKFKKEKKSKMLNE